MSFAKIIYIGMILAFGAGINTGLGLSFFLK